MTVLRVEQRGAVRWLHLHRPEKRNALDGEVIARLTEQVAEIERDDATRVVVIAGDGPAFSAGGDFRYFLDAEGPGGVVDFLAELSACFRSIELSRKPWVAAVHGHAIAGGLELALVCDVVIAARGALIGDGHVNNRLIAGGGSSVRLERAVGKATARWLHLSGQPLPAEDFPPGWLHAVVDEASLLAAAGEAAAVLAAREPIAQQNMKRQAQAVHGLPLDEGLSLELDHFAANWTDSDAEAALTHFLTSRTSTETLA